MQMFADVVTIKAQAGKGGDGLVGWRREKYIAKGGPDGGDGGNGGSVVVVADNNLNTLAAYRNKPLIKAKNGENGRRRRQHGKTGEDSLVNVPVGTVVWEDTTELADLSQPGQRVIVAGGGKGGFGNAHFKSSKRQAPELAELGEDSQAKELRLELKLIADVGLVGLPNAGKSTLLSIISNAKPEIADYPFTTLVPNLGVADIDEDSLLVADIPGLIEGAHEGKGLGHDFLRHIERTAVLLHLIDATLKDPVAAYKTIVQELKSHQQSLAKKPQILVLTKIDGMPQAQLSQTKAQLKRVAKAEIFAISAVAKQGLEELLRMVLKTVKAERRAASRRAAKKQEPVPILSLADDPNAWWVEKHAGHFIVRGGKIEGFGRRTNINNAAALDRLRDILHKQGIDRELVRLGVKMGDTIEIATKTFSW